MPDFQPHARPTVHLSCRRALLRGQAALKPKEAAPAAGGALSQAATATATDAAELGLPPEPRGHTALQREDGALSTTNSVTALHQKVARPQKAAPETLGTAQRQPSVKSHGGRDRKRDTPNTAGEESAHERGCTLQPHSEAPAPFPQGARVVCLTKKIIWAEHEQGGSADRDPHRAVAPGRPSAEGGQLADRRGSVHVGGGGGRSPRVAARRPAEEKPVGRPRRNGASRAPG